MSDDERLAIQKLESKLEADAKERITWRQGLSDKMDTRIRIDEDHRKYMHERLHDLLDEIALISAKITSLPCDQHGVDFAWFKNSIYLLYGVVGAIIAFLVKVHIGV